MTVAESTRFAAELFGALVGHGVTDVVVCPGSRSQSLALAAAALAESGALRLHVRIDERAAAFLALGLAVETGVPAPVITTSGSAVANLLPAVVESHHAGVPLILLTADRPASARGTGANQVTIQPGMFANFVAWEVDVPPPGSEGTPATELATSAWSHARDGVAHVNLQFVEPLSSDFDAECVKVFERARDAARILPSSSTPSSAPLVELPVGPRTIVIAGADSGHQAEDGAYLGNWPLLAEVSSGARYGRNLIVNYRAAIASAELGGRVERVVVFGHPTLSREVPALLGRPGVEVVRIPRGTDIKLFADASATAGADEGKTDWLREWQRFDRAATEKRVSRLAAVSPALRAPDVDAARSTAPDDQREFLRVELEAVRAEVTRELLVDAVWRATWPHDRLVFGASRLIRVADATVAGKKIRVHANRGLSGIDGTISTGVGIALGSAQGVTRVLLGDITALHDVGGMFFPSGEERPRVQVIVGNDGGGTIFDSLEVAQSANRDAFNRVMFTPQNTSFEKLADAYGWTYVRVTNVGELERALTATADGPSLVDVVLAR